MKFTTKQMRELVGKRVEYILVRDTHYENPPTRVGIVEEVSGKNIRIDGDWRWFGSHGCDIYSIKEKRVP